MDDDFEQKSVSFVEWLRRIPNATVSDKIALADLRGRGAGRGVVARQNIEQDEDLFTVPRNSIICVENSDLSQKIPHIFEELDPWLSLILVLIYEHLQGHNSRWKTYFDILPTQFDTLMFWEDVELEELQGSAVRQKIGKESADVMFRESILPVIRQQETLFFPPGSAQVSEEHMMALAHRMGSTIMAYAFDLEKSESQVEVDEDGYATEDEDEMLPKGMVPMADMLNSNAIFNARLFYGEETLTMRALEPISAGEQVLNDYGPLPRSDLLRRYGYITPDYAQYDVVELSQSLVLEEIQKYRRLGEEDLETRLAYLENKDALEEGYLLERQDSSEGTASTPISVTNDDQTTIPADLRLLLQTLLCKPDEYRMLRTLADIRLAALFLDTCKVFVQILQARRRQYATSVETDTALLQDTSLSGRLRAAIEVRLAEKQILEEAQKGPEIIVQHFMSSSSGDNTAESNGQEPSRKRRRMA